MRWTTLARVLLAIALVWIVLAFRDYGLSWDEEHSAQNGEYAAAWFRTLGHDDRVITSFNQRFYGSAFNLTSHLIAGVSPIGSYETGHLLIALVAWVGLLFTFRLARLAGGDRAGFCALLFLAMTPVWVGHGFMNPKDVPLAALFVTAAYFMIRATTELPAPSGATLASFAVVTGLAAGVRVIGIFLVGYWALALGVWWLVAAVTRRPRPPVWRVLLWWLLSALAAWTIMVVCWPYAQLDPFRNPVRALLDSASFEFQGAMLFDGTGMSPQSLPRSYLPTWFSISLPEFYACGIVGALVPAVAFLVRDGRGRRARTTAVVALVLMMMLLPPALAIWQRAVMYDGMRHFLFVLPFLAVLAGWGFAAAIGDLGAAVRRPSALRVLRAAVAVVPVAAGLVSLALTAVDFYELHPYEYIYFNRLVAGGEAAAATRFETDYWGLSYKEGLEWLGDHYPAGSTPITVANCSSEFLTSYWIHTQPALAARFTASSQYTNPPPRILLATTRYNCHKRGGRTLYVVSRKDVPLMYVLEHEDPGRPGS